jgi:adenylate kinase
MERQGTVIVLLGPPGAGKGTQADALSSSLGIPTISTGEMLRQECRSVSQLGAQVQALLDSGQLVGDELVQEVVARRLAKSDCAQGCILDGFPRTAGQARFLEQLLARMSFEQPAVFDLVISPEVLIERLSNRRQCPSCARTFQVPGPCPHDGAPLEPRADDQPDTIRRRLQVYSQHTAEIVRFYQNRGYVRVDAAQSAGDITRQIVGVLGTISCSTKDFKPSVLVAQHLCV